MPTKMPSFSKVRKSFSKSLSFSKRKDTPDKPTPPPRKSQQSTEVDPPSAEKALAEANAAEKERLADLVLQRERELKQEQERVAAEKAAAKEAADAAADDAAAAAKEAAEARALAEAARASADAAKKEAEARRAATAAAEADNTRTIQASMQQVRQTRLDSEQSRLASSPVAAAEEGWEMVERDEVPDQSELLASNLVTRAVEGALAEVDADAPAPPPAVGVGGVSTRMDSMDALEAEAAEAAAAEEWSDALQSDTGSPSPAGALPIESPTTGGAPAFPQLESPPQWTPPVAPPPFSAQQSVIMIPRTGGSGMASTSEEMSTGFTLNKAGDFAGARKCFLEAYQLRGQRAEAQLSAANMALKLGETATAESEYKAILLRDDLTENLRRMAETKLASVVTTTAPPLFSSPAGTSINRTPSVLMPAVGGTDAASVEMAAGFAANKKGDYELARKHFLAAYDLQGERIEARMSAANMAYKMNDLHTAEDEYKEILQRSNASESLKRMATEKLASLAERTFPDERPASRFGTQAHLLLEPAAAPTLTQPRQRRTPLLKPLLVLCCVVLPILLAVALVKLDWAACEAAPETASAFSWSKAPAAPAPPAYCKLLM